MPEAWVLSYYVCSPIKALARQWPFVIDRAAFFCQLVANMGNLHEYKFIWNKQIVMDLASDCLIEIYSFRMRGDLKNKRLATGKTVQTSILFGGINLLFFLFWRHLILLHHIPVVHMVAFCYDIWKTVLITQPCVTTGPVLVAGVIVDWPPVFIFTSSYSPGRVYERCLPVV